MMIIILIIALIIVIGQLESKRKNIQFPQVYHNHYEEHSYFINDKKVSKEEFDNSFKSYLK
jgi:hypothetical protein